MRPVRPFDSVALKPGQASDWLIGPADDVGVTLRIRRGGGDQAEAMIKVGIERFMLILEGNAVLSLGDERQQASPGELVFVPAGQAVSFSTGATTVWAEIEAPLPDAAPPAEAQARIIQVEPSKFLGGGFAYQALIDRCSGSRTMRMNVLQVAPGSGSPDFHIHAFAQIYLIQEGEMTLDIGRKRVRAGKDSVVFLPAGLVHRNFNASGALERHISLLVPEPREGEIFDYAVTIADVEAKLLEAIPP